MTAPIIPQLTDKDMEAILEAATANGAAYAGWTMLRLPFEVKTLFRDWLAQHYPLRAGHVMSIVQQIRGGRDNDPPRAGSDGHLALQAAAQRGAACAAHPFLKWRRIPRAGRRTN